MYVASTHAQSCNPPIASSAFPWSWFSHQSFAFSAHSIRLCSRLRSTGKRQYHKKAFVDHGRIFCQTNAFSSASVADTRIPVTVITGFLGSGKTTLLNNILSKDHGQRIAVIENEFGEIDIDSELVSQKYELKGTGDPIMVLNNGCLCCTVREDLVKSLNALYERRSEFDRIVIETTGLAKVAPMISTFYLTEHLPERVRLDGVVTIVDAKHIERHMDKKSDTESPSEAIEQIAYADRIIINKTDLVQDVNLDDLIRRVKEINSMAMLRQSTYASVPVDYVLGVGGFDINRIDEQLSSDEMENKNHHHHGEEAHDHHDEDDSHDHHLHRDHFGHDHEDDISSVSIEIDGEMDLERINVVLGAIVELRGEDIYRMKGIISIKGWQERFVFQGVHMMFQGIPDRFWRPDEKRVSKMVFIGRHLNKADFEEALLACKV